MPAAGASKSSWTPIVPPLPLPDFTGDAVKLPIAVGGSTLTLTVVSGPPIAPRSALSQSRRSTFATRTVPLVTSIDAAVTSISKSVPPLLVPQPTRMAWLIWMESPLTIVKSGEALKSSSHEPARMLVAGSPHSCNPSSASVTSIPSASPVVLRSSSN